MAALENQRHELFALAISRGASASAAYVEAGYKGSTANAARLRATAAIRQRLAELQAEAGAKHEITIESICAELNEAVALAKSRGMANALVNVAALRAKLAGLGSERQIVEINDSTGSFDTCGDIEAVARQMADGELDQLTNARWLPIDENDRAFLASIFLECFTRAKEFVRSVENRPLLKEGMVLLTERDVKPKSGNGTN